MITASAIKLLILTGARRSEVAAMQWNELDLKTCTWVLPSERTINGQAHMIYLSDLAIKIINQLRLITGCSNFVFDTGYYEKSGHIHPDTLTGAIAKLRGAYTGTKKKIIVDSPISSIKPFSNHELRRTAATAWGEYLKTDPHVIERMLNHQPLNKLVSIYQRAVYADEQRDTWLKWGNLLKEVCYERIDKENEKYRYLV